MQQMILDTGLIHCEKVLTQPVFEALSSKRTQRHAQGHFDSTGDKECFGVVELPASHRSFPDEGARFKCHERNSENAHEWRHMR